MKLQTKLFGGLAILAAGGGVVGGLLLGGKDGEVGLDGGVIVPMHKEVTIENVAPIAIVSPSGKKVFVVNEIRPETPAVTESELGKVVIKDVVSDQAECNIVFEAKLVKKTYTGPHGSITRDEPDFAVTFGNITPVLIHGSCTAEKVCIFNELLRGQECLKAVDIPGYLCSTMTDCMALPDATKARFLKQEGTCTVNLGDAGTKEVNCAVPYGDPKAKPDSKVFFPHAWSGRVDVQPLEAIKIDGGFKALDRAEMIMAAQPVKIDAGVVEEPIEEVKP